MTTKWIRFSLIMMLAFVCLVCGLVFIALPPHSIQWNIIGGFYVAIGIIALVFNVIVVGSREY